jgi:hypothetical protein
MKIAVLGAGVQAICAASSLPARTLAAQNGRPVVQTS